MNKPTPEEQMELFRDSELTTQCDKCSKGVNTVYPNYAIDSDPDISPVEFGECGKCYYV